MQLSLWIGTKGRGIAAGLALACLAACLAAGDAGTDITLTEYFEDRAHPLEDAAGLAGLTAAAAGRRLVLLGEASHGTSEFYVWRDRISRRLVGDHGFAFIAVEGDWASLNRLDDYVRHAGGDAASAREVMRTFRRWPPWMWANAETEALAEWLREYNAGRSPEERVGIFGMDVYGQWEAKEELLRYAREHLPEHHERIEAKLRAFSGDDRDEWRYGRAVAMGAPPAAGGLRRIVDLLDAHAEDLAAIDRRAFLRARQNAKVVLNAEDFFRLAVVDGRASWNSRVDHMWATVRRLLAAHGDGARGIVWAHNTHIGDSAATGMRLQGQYNIGHLSRRDLGREQVLAVGFGTYRGRVSAGSRWGAPMQIMAVPRAQPDSFEAAMGRVTHPRFYLLFDDADRAHALLREARGHRSIGVVYNPMQERGNYVPTVLPHRYDAFVFIRETGPLTTFETGMP